MRRGAMMVLAAAGLSAGATAAMAQEAGFSLSLIGSEPKDGKCAYVLDAKNKLGIDLDEFKVQVYGLSATNTSVGLWTLPFSNLKDKKRQIKSFVLPMTCDKIVRFYFAGFTECKGDKDYLDACGKSVTLSSNIEVGFSDE